MIVTVTLNAALDRSLTVPSFKIGHRHRASGVLALAGGKGINVARALKRLDMPVVATGLAGGRTGTRIVEELTEEAILNDFVRIRDESRTSTAVVDPTDGTYTEINEWGPKVSEAELGILLDKLRYLSRGRVDRRLRRLAAARGRRRVLCGGGPGDDPTRCARRARRRGRAAEARASRPSRGSSPRTSTRPSSSWARSWRTTTTSSWPSTGSPRWAHATSTSRWRRRASRSFGRSARCAGTALAHHRSSRSRSSAPVTFSSRSGSSPREKGSRRTSHCVARLQPAPRRCSRSEPAGSTARKRHAWRSSSRSTSWSRRLVRPPSIASRFGDAAVVASRVLPHR